jgi:hypothetical protein
MDAPRVSRVRRTIRQLVSAHDGVSGRLVYLCQSMTPRARRMAQRIIRVDAKSLDDSTDGERRQAGLPLVKRGPLSGSGACIRRRQLMLNDGRAYLGV